jgi:hypothetical protein
MSGRALLAIGCDVYDHLGPLSGAEADARAIFEVLMKPEVGDYDAGRSQLLLSPNLQDIRNAVTALLFGDGPLDALTIVFAGHGAVSGGSFYMAARDSRSQGLSATGFPLAELLRIIAEAAPRQTYVFVDACQAGGLVSDLNVILKAEIMGQFGTPGVTVLATAASDQQAVEVGGHGLGTTALLQCIRGEIFLQDSNPALDLVEIGRAVSDRVAAAGGQTPVVWGLNLYGPSSFCRNPHAHVGDAPLRSVLVGWPDAATTAAIRAGLPRLWEPYVRLSTRWDARAFLECLTPLVSELRADPAIQADFLRRIAVACATQARGSKDRFREIEVLATCSVALLPFSNEPAIRSYLMSCCENIGVLVERAVAEVVTGIDGYRFALVTNGMADLYELPIRLSRLLGWSAYAAHVRLATNRETGPAVSRLEDLFGRIFDTYSLSLVAMSDLQAPFILAAATAAARLGLAEEGERLLGHMFSSLVDCRGWVARGDLDPAKVLDYLLARSAGIKPPIEMMAQPTELAVTLLRAARLFDLTDDFDSYLERLDHLALNAYLPEDYRQFGEEHIASGTNAVFVVGHDIWSVADLETAWPDFPTPSNPTVAMVSLLSSLIFPDRVAWFLLPVPSLIEGTEVIGTET